MPADKPWNVVSVTRRSSGVAPRACVRVYARVLVPPNLYIHTYIHIIKRKATTQDEFVLFDKIAQTKSIKRFAAICTNCRKMNMDC